MNHLIIGLGGTGGKVLAAFRRLVFQQYRNVEPNALSIDYLYIDSSETDARNADIGQPLKEGDQMWRTLGTSVQLSPAQIVPLRQGAFKQVIDHVEDYPTLSRWIGDIPTWQDIWSGAPNGIEAGGQIRRFGRFLFAQNAAAVVSALQDRFNAPSRSGSGAADARWTVHVVAGLAGGTGSGTVIDVLGQLRRLRSIEDTKIVLYAVLPETEQTSWAKENYYANGYAALAEINALLVGQYKPSDVASTAGRYQSDPPINNVFLITNRNQNGLLVSVDTAVPQIVADTLFQLVVASGDARAIGSQDSSGAGSGERLWRDMITGENNQGDYEKDGSVKARANRFLSFGIKRVAVPHQEIREFATLAFLRQSMLQLINNNWSDGLGFVDTPVRFDGAAVARSDENREKWMLSDQHLMLERKTLDNDGQDWSGLHDQFLNPLNTQAIRIRGDVKSDDQWIQPLEEAALERYQRGFRRVGVPEFYRIAERSLVDRARLIRDRIGDDLFARWSNGERSARDIQRVLEELVVDIQERLATADKRVQDNVRIEGEKETERKRSREDYAGFGGKGAILGRVLYSRPEALSRHARVLAELYTAKSRQIAAGYMRHLLSLTLNEVQALAADVQVVADRLVKAAEIADKRRATRVPANEAADNRAHVFKFYDREHVRQVVARLETDAEVQKPQTADLRASLIKELGAKPSFHAFVEQLSEWRLIEKLERAAEQEAEQALSGVEVTRDRVLESSILQKLHDEYQGRDEDLRRFLGDRVREAGSYAQFAPNQSIAHDGAKVERCLVAFLPAAEELPEQLRSFRDHVADILRKANPGGATEVVEVRGRQHEITFLSLVNQFPLRQLQALELLKSRYEALVGDPKKARRKQLELHTEGDGKALPSLYPDDADAVRRKCAPYWLIAESAGLIQERQNPRTGQPEVFAVVADEDGAKVPVRFGESFAKGVRTLDLAKASDLRALVQGHLSELVHVDQKAALRKRLVERQNSALEAASFNQDDEYFVTVKTAVSEARELAGT